MNPTCRVVTSLAIALAGGCALRAQSSETGAMTGIIQNAGGKPLAGIEIRAASSQTTRRAITDAQGRFKLNLLGLGKWMVTAHAPGYQTVTATAVLGINETRTFNFTLATVAGATVTVVAKAEELDLAGTQVTTQFSAESLAQLPANHTSLYALDSIVMTVPGVQSTGMNNFQFFGGTSDQNLFVVDGNSTNSTQFNAAQTQVNGLPPREFLESVEVVTGGFGAEYNVLGGVVNMASKMGSNTWSGSVYGYTNFPNSTARQRYNPQALQAAPAPYNTNTRFGATISGPILKDKLFMFLGVQGSKTEQPPSGVGGANWNGFVSSSATTNGPNTLTAKLNWIINPNHELVFATTNARMKTESGNQYPGDLMMATGSNNMGTHSTMENQSTNLTWNWTITPHLYLVTSIGNHTDPIHTYATQPSADGSWSPITDYQYFLTGPGANAPNKPSDYQYYSYQGGTGAILSQGSNPNKQFRLDLTWTAGNHTVKAGYSRQQSRLESTSGGTKSYSIYSDDNNYGMTGDPTDLEMWYSAPKTRDFRGTYRGYYLKDVWEVTPGVHLDLGLRFDPITIESRTPPNDGKTLLNFSNFGRQVQPRLGIAWDVHRDGKTKLYANFGRFFQTMPLQNFNWATSSFSSVSYWNASQWTYNTNYGAFDPAFTINTDPATGKPFDPYLVFPMGSTTLNPPMANDLRLPHKDGVVLGVDQVLKGGWTVGGTWRWWKIGNPIVQSFFTNPDGTNPFNSDQNAQVVWNPHSGPVTFTAGNGKVLTYDSPFPDPKEIYLALNLHAKVQREDWFLSVDYTWTHHYGNFRGLSGATTSTNAGNITGTGGTSDWVYYQTINNGNNEANPVHEFKAVGSFAIPVLGQKLNLGPVLIWQSGFGLTSAVPISNLVPKAFRGAYTMTSSNGITGNMGHTPSLMNLDLNADMVIKVGPATLTPTVAVTNFFNSRAITQIQTQKQFAGGRSYPYFGMPTGWQPGRAVTAGLSVKF